METSTATHQSAIAVDPLDRLPAVLAVRGVRKSQHHNDIKSGLYTPPVKLGPRASGWPRSEVAALNSARIAGKSADDIRALVQKLMAARVAMA